MSEQSVNRLAEQVYSDIKAEIFDFRMLPGDRFTETELASRYQVSRTPVRDALYRLKREGYLDVAFRSGWSVRPFDFVRFDELYELRLLLECAAVEKLCRLESPADLPTLRAVWLVEASQRESDSLRVAELDEAFHASLVQAAGNRECALIHAQLTEQIRIIRRLDFRKQQRIDATYNEHAKVLRLIQRRKETEALLVLRAHITHSKQEVRKITLHMLHEARNTLAARSETDAAPPVDSLTQAV